MFVNGQIDHPPNQTVHTITTLCQHHNCTLLHNILICAHRITRQSCRNTSANTTYTQTLCAWFPDTHSHIHINNTFSQHTNATAINTCWIAIVDESTHHDSHTVNVTHCSHTPHDHTTCPQQHTHPHVQSCDWTYMCNHTICSQHSHKHIIKHNIQRLLFDGITTMPTMPMFSEPWNPHHTFVVHNMHQIRTTWCVRRISCCRHVNGGIPHTNPQFPNVSINQTVKYTHHMLVMNLIILATFSQHNNINMSCSMPITTRTNNSRINWVCTVPFINATHVTIGALHIAYVWNMHCRTNTSIQLGNSHTPHDNNATSPHNWVHDPDLTCIYKQQYSNDSCTILVIPYETHIPQYQLNSCNACPVHEPGFVSRVLVTMFEQRVGSNCGSPHCNVIDNNCGVCRTQFSQSSRCNQFMFWYNNQLVSQTTIAGPHTWHRFNTIYTV